MKQLSGLTYPSKNLQLLHKIDYNIIINIDFEKGVPMKLFKTFSEREVKKIGSVCDLVLKLDPDMAKLTDADLRAKTEEFRMRYNKGESLDSMFVEAFAVVREASWRVLRMKHYPVQVIGGIVLHRGNIAEMRTG